MIKGIKVMLLPNKKQYSKLFECAGVRRFAYFKSKKKTIPKFYVDTDKIQFIKEHIKLEKLTQSKKKNKQKFNSIKLSERERIPVNCNYSNPKVSYEGIYWFISISIETEDMIETAKNEGIGIDLGIKALKLFSDILSKDDELISERLQVLAFILKEMGYSRKDL